ncbi:MAG: SH3 domain-containing protein, partial [Chloroflexota bacterium]
LRDRPTADGRVVVGIPSGESMVINGRNGDGTWVQVTYSSPTGDLEGWVATQYLIITRAGQPYDVRNLPILTGEADAMSG